MITEEKAKKETENILEKYRLRSVKTLTTEDRIKIKKFIRIVNLLPDGGQKYLPEFKSFHEKYGYWVFNHLDELSTLRYEVCKEIICVDPISEEDIKIVADVWIRKAQRWGIE